MNNDDDQFAYIILANAFSDTPYIQREHWSTQRGFKLDLMLAEPEYIESGVPNQVRTGDEGTTIPSVTATL